MPPLRNILRPLTYSIFICLLALAAKSGAETVVEFNRDRLVVIDSLSDSGIIARPLICPVDSNYIAYEIHRGQSIDLFLYNLIAGERRRIDQTFGKEGEIIIDPDSVINRDFAWRPVRSDKCLWGAYVSNRNGKSELFLFDAYSEISYRLVAFDTLSSDKDFEIAGLPSWSPDGRCLAYTVVSAEDHDIHIYCSMRRILENIDQKSFSRLPDVAIADSGDQFGPAWCPVPSSGYLAYTELKDIQSRLRIRVFDLLSGKSYSMTGADPALDYFAPSWNAGGKRLAYYIIDNDSAHFSRYSGPEDHRLKIGVSSISILNGTPVITPLRGGAGKSETIVDIIPDFDRFSAPVWLPGGQHLGVSVYGDLRSGRLRSLSLPEWEAGETESDYWLRGFGDDRYDFPRDLNVVRRSFSFTFRKPTGQYLLSGRMLPSIKLVMVPDNIEIARNRAVWWDNYSGGGEGGGFLAKIGNFLWSPIAGPDLGINRGIVPVAGGIILLMAVLGGDDDSGPAPPRDWTPPQFPDEKRPGISFKIGLGF